MFQTHNKGSAWSSHIQRLKHIEEMKGNAHNQGQKPTKQAVLKSCKNKSRIYRKRGKTQRKLNNKINLEQDVDIHCT